MFRTAAGSAAGGAAVAAVWIAPAPLAYLLGRLSFTYGNPYFDPAFRAALPAVGLALLAAFAAGTEPFLRDGRGTTAARATATVAALLALAALRGRPGSGAGAQWLLLLWEVFCLRLAALALIRLTGSLLGGAVLLAGFCLVRFFVLSRVDGAYETFAHYVAAPRFHLGVSLAWPTAVASALLLAARSAPPRRLVGAW